MHKQMRYSLFKFWTLFLIFLPSIIIQAYTPLVYLDGQAFNVGQPYGLCVFDTYMHNRGSFKPGFQCTPSIDIGQGKHFLGLDLLLSYHQNMYNLLDGLFFQTHLLSGVGFSGNGGNLDLVLGYYWINTPYIVSIYHIDAILSGELRDIKGNNQRMRNQKIGIGLCSWIKLYQSSRHSLLLFNELRWHHQFPAQRLDWSGMLAAGIKSGNLADIMTGLIYQYKAFFLDTGFDYHINHSKKICYYNDKVFPSSQALNLYADLGLVLGNIFDLTHSTTYCSIGSTISCEGLRKNTMSAIMVTVKSGIAF